MYNSISSFFFFNHTATTEIYTLSLHDALPICEEEEGGDLLGTELADQALAERPQPAAAIEDDQRPVVQPDFQARRVSAVPRVTPLRSGSGTAHPPELESHEETF